MVSLFPILIAQLYILSNERELNLDKHFFQIGISYIHFTTSWIISVIIHNIPVFCLLMAMLRISKIALYTSNSALILYGISLAFNYTLHVLLISIISRNFNLNLLIFITSIFIQNFAGGFYPYLPTPLQQIVVFNIIIFSILKKNYWYSKPVSSNNYFTVQ